ncbi:hypothetical protein PAMP_022503 [Pampus punctatissimus]
MAVSICEWNKGRELVNGQREVTRPSIDSSADRASSADEKKSQCLMSTLIYVSALVRTIA